MSTGSSALPQKRNPDIAELVRGRSAAVIGDLASILAHQTGLPLTYNRDLQEDKRIVFHADDSLAGSIEAMAALLAGLVFHPAPPDSTTSALDLAEALVRRGVPFREAHGIVGELVRDAVALGVSHGLPVMFVTEDTTRAKPEEAPGPTAPGSAAEDACIAATWSKYDPVRSTCRPSNTNEPASDRWPPATAPSPAPWPASTLSRPWMAAWPPTSIATMRRVEA